MGYKLENQKIEPLNITTGPSPTITKTWDATIEEMKQKVQNLNHRSTLLTTSKP